jgi:hypothetical protein
MAHLTYLIIFHFEMIICQNANLSHTYGHCLENINLWYDNYEITHIVHKYVPMES